MTLNFLSTAHYLLITIFYLLFICISYKNIKWGVFLVVTLLPTYLIRFTILGIPATLLEGMIWLLFIIWLVKMKKEKNLTFNPLTWLKNISHRSLVIDHQNPIPRLFRLPIVLFLIAATFSVFVSPDFRAALGIWKAYFVEALMFFIVFVYTIKTSADLKKVIRFLGLTVLVISVFAIIQKFTGLFIPNSFWANEATRRVTTFFGYPNANALFILPILFLTLGNLLTDKVIDHRSSIIGHRSSNLVVLILGITTVIWTKSTGAVIGLVIGLIFLLIFYKKTRLITLLIILIASLGLTFSPAIKLKMTETLTVISQTHLPLDASDLHMRAQQWRETFSMLKDTPIFGPGLSGYQTLMVPYHQNPHVEIYLYPHNFFLNFWTETGILGLIAIIWILVVFFVISFKFLVLNLQSNKNLKLKTENYTPSTNEQWLTLTTTCAMIALLVHGLVDVPYFKNDLSILFWIIIASAIILYNERRSASQP